MILLLQIGGGERSACFARRLYNISLSPRRVLVQNFDKNNVLSPTRCFLEH